MPSKRPPTSGYARIAQAEEEDEEGYSEASDEENFHNSQRPISGIHYTPIQPGRQSNMRASGSGSKEFRHRHRSNSGVDIKAINARLEKWADEIASKFKIRKGKGRTEGEEPLEIHHSVFQAPDWIRPATAESLEHEDRDRLTKDEFDQIVESVRTAIELGVHPKLISQGSSGSYFARDTKGKVVGVFKPKDEEPYASRNPKWTKWIHRNLFPWFFGRACLIPNLSYVSEAAAYVLDTQLRTGLVPYTDIVSLSSKSFFYDFWDRRAYYRKKKPLPEKIGSFQIFLKGYKDANKFLKEHPWPDQHSNLKEESSAKRQRRRWAEECRPGGTVSDDEDAESHERDVIEETQRRKVFWTDALQQSFREQLEKLVILDYIMRNTDRGLDNWMIRIDQTAQKASIISDPGDIAPSSQANEPYGRQEPMSVASRSATPSVTSPSPSVSIGAIDNSLSWPWKHPDAWRSYPFGWLFLPVSLIGQPFSEATRKHFLPLLTSKDWWRETQQALRRCFSQDADFKERMFAKQMAVMKGQAWNVVEALKTPDHGPLELTRRARVCVWDDVVDVPVAVPLRVPSEEMRRRGQQELPEEELDLSAAHASAPQPGHDLLGIGSPRHSPMPNGKRFDLTRHSSSQDVERTDATADASQPSRAWQSDVNGITNPELLNTGRDRSKRTSYDGHGSRSRASPEHRRRRYSYAARRSSNAILLGDDDLAGDLGYAVAEDMEGNHKRVIVERLEMVKGRNPVFTWC